MKCTWDCKDKLNDAYWSHLRTAKNQFTRKGTFAMYQAQLSKATSKATKAG